MSQHSDIEWTDATWNPVRGCTKVSPGCDHCYAETFAERFRGVPGHPYEQGFDLRLVPEKLAEPLRWKTPKMIFVNSMSDLFHKDVPDDYVEAVCRVMERANWHTYQVLTKWSVSQIMSRLAGHRLALSLGSEKELFVGLDLRHQGHQFCSVKLPSERRGAAVGEFFVQGQPQPQGFEGKRPPNPFWQAICGAN